MHDCNMLYITDNKGMELTLTGGSLNPHFSLGAEVAHLLGRLLQTLAVFNHRKVRCNSPSVKIAYCVAKSK